MRKLIWALAGCAAATSNVEPPDAASDAPRPRATFRNPLNAGADPFMTYYDGSYYLTTTQGDAMRMWKAASLAELAIAPAVTIWRDSDPSRDREVWAPSFYRFAGRWYVYYTADDGIDDHHRIYVIESAGGDPLGPYHFKAKLEAPGAGGRSMQSSSSRRRAGTWSGAVPARKVTTCSTSRRSPICGRYQGRASICRPQADAAKCARRPR